MLEALQSGDVVKVSPVRMGRHDAHGRAALAVRHR